MKTNTEWSIYFIHSEGNRAFVPVWIKEIPPMLLLPIVNSEMLKVIYAFRFLSKKSLAIVIKIQVVFVLVVRLVCWINPWTDNALDYINYRIYK